DVRGAALLSVVLVLLLLPISKAPTWGLAKPLPLAMFGLAAVGAVAWLRYERRCDSPVVDVEVMRRRPVMLANIAGTALGFGMFANFFVTISILQLSDVVSHG